MNVKVTTYKLVEHRQMRNWHKILVEKPQCRSGDDIKIYLKEIWCKVVNGLQWTLDWTRSNGLHNSRIKDKL